MKWPMDKIFVQNNAPQARFFCEKTAQQAKIMKENDCPFDVVCKSLFTNHWSEYFFFK